MRQKILSFIHAKTPFSEDTRAATARLTMLLLWGVTLVLHLFFLGYFFTQKIIPLVWYQVGSSLFYALVYPVIRRGKLVAAAFMFVLEVITFCLFSVYYLSAEALIQWYLILLLVPIYFYIHCKNFYRFLISALAVLGMAACLLLHHLHNAPYAGTPIVSFLFYWNSVVVVVSLVLELTTEKIVRHALLLLLNRDVERLRRQSFRDPLTDLYNRRYADFLFQELSQKKPSGDAAATDYCVAMIDIDDFSMINNTLGHEVGDMVLRRMAAIMRANTRVQDTIFRWGGEEFLILFKNTQLEQAKKLSLRLREEVTRERQKVQMQLPFPTVTIGVATVYDCNFEEAIRVADIHLYAGKNNGKNCVIH